MKPLLQIAIAVGLLVVCTARVQACSCADPSQRKKFRTADVVFLGEIVERHYLSDLPKDALFMQSVTFSVKRQWKGPKQKQLSVLFDFDAPGWCSDMPLIVGREYLTYVYREKAGWASFTDCGPNVEKSLATEDMKKLDSFWFRLSARLWLFN